MLRMFFTSFYSTYIHSIYSYQFRKQHLKTLHHKAWELPTSTLDIQYRPWTFRATYGYFCLTHFTPKISYVLRIVLTICHFRTTWIQATLRFEFTATEQFFTPWGQITLELNNLSKLTNENEFFNSTIQSQIKIFHVWRYHGLGVNCQQLPTR